MKRYSLFAIVTVGVFFFFYDADAAYKRIPNISILNVEKDFAVGSSFHPFKWKDISGVNIEVFDLDGDGKAEIITAPGVGKEPRIYVYNAKGKRIRDFRAYEPTMGRGLNIAVGDVNGDGSPEIVTAPEFGAGAHVKIFDAAGNAVFVEEGFFAFEENFTGGVDVALGDVNGDGKSEIITSRGGSGASEVRLWNEFGELISEFIAFEDGFSSGVSLAAADFDDDQKDEIIVSQRGYGIPLVRIFSFSNDQWSLLHEFMAFDDIYMGGVEVSVWRKSGEAPRIAAAKNAIDPDMTINIFEADGNRHGQVMPKMTSENIIWRAAFGDISGKGKSAMITAPHHPMATSTVQEKSKWFEIDLSLQQLFAWENGQLAHTFLISSGTNRFPTPKGTFEIFRKLPKHDYIRIYGQNHPDNYSIKNVPYNLNFSPSYYIHNAFWHNNFGYPMSHGCINAALDTSEWAYQWADIGTQVEIHE